MASLPVDPIIAVFAENLSNLMRDHGVNQSELARRSGVAQKTISNIVRTQHSVQIDNLSKLSCALGVPGWSLLVPGLYRNPERAGKVLSFVQAG
jgi:transcriptional regulator with XRE-family HTH domain